jgi:hypothetical protein
MESATSLNTVCASRIVANFGYDQGSASRAGSLPIAGRARLSAMRRSGSRNGSGRRSIAFTALKMAVLAPMPIASVSTATAVKPGVRRKARRANRRSCVVVSSQESPAVMRASSFVFVTLPNRRRAACDASSALTAPRPACSRCIASSERCRRISSSNSRACPSGSRSTRQR